MIHDLFIVFSSLSMHFDHFTDLLNDLLNMYILQLLIKYVIKLANVVFFLCKLIGCKTKGKCHAFPNITRILYTLLKSDTFFVQLRTEHNRTEFY